VAIGRVAAATIAQQQNGCRFWVILHPDTLPVSPQAFSGKLARVMRQAKVDVPTVQNRIIDSVWDYHPVSPAWKVMVKRMQGFGASDASSTVQPAQMLFCFGIDGKVRISQERVLVDQFANSEKLGFTIRCTATGDVLDHFPRTQSDIGEPSVDCLITDWRSVLRSNVGQLCSREIGKNHICIIRVTGHTSLQHLVQIVFKSRLGFNFFFSSSTRSSDSA